MVSPNFLPDFKIPNVCFNSLKETSIYATFPLLPFSFILAHISQQNLSSTSFIFVICQWKKCWVNVV